ncbi:MAG: hypothetical protein IIA49_11295 [Bacteroidetes bacterium]|nr:hypothetical protein [Bacteroidota bacterium]
MPRIEFAALILITFGRLLIFLPMRVDVQQVHHNGLDGKKSNWLSNIS